MSITIRRLPDAELEVMNAVWDCAPPVARIDIECILQDKHPMAATTILTLLMRLVEKNFLVYEKRGRSNYYTPIITKRDYLASQSKRFVDKLCGGDISIFATALCDSGLSRSDINELRSLLEEGGI